MPRRFAAWQPFDVLRSLVEVCWGLGPATPPVPAPPAPNARPPCRPTNQGDGFVSATATSRTGEANTYPAALLAPDAEELVGRVRFLHGSDFRRAGPVLEQTGRKLHNLTEQLGCGFASFAGELSAGIDFCGVNWWGTSGVRLGAATWPVVWNYANLKPALDGVEGTVHRLQASLTSVEEYARRHGGYAGLGIAQLCIAVHRLRQLDEDAYQGTWKRPLVQLLREMGEVPPAEADHRELEEVAKKVLEGPALGADLDSVQLGQAAYDQFGIEAPWGNVEAGTFTTNLKALRTIEKVNQNIANLPQVGGRGEAERQAHLHLIRLFRSGKQFLLDVALLRRVQDPAYADHAAATSALFADHQMFRANCREYLQTAVEREAPVLCLGAEASCKLFEQNAFPVVFASTKLTREDFERTPLSGRIVLLS